MNKDAKNIKYKRRISGIVYDTEIATLIALEEIDMQDMFHPAPGFRAIYYKRRQYFLYAYSPPVLYVPGKEEIVLVDSVYATREIERINHGECWIDGRTGLARNIKYSEVINGTLYDTTTAELRDVWDDTLHDPIDEVGYGHYVCDATLLHENGREFVYKLVVNSPDDILNPFGVNTHREEWIFLQD